MTNIVFYLLSLLGLVFLLLAILWLIIPLITGLPWVPSQSRRIHRALQMADIQPGDVVYDLGAGDGRVLIAAARDFHARAVGIEISPVHCLITYLRACFSGVRHEITIHQGNFYHADISNADVVFIYATSKYFTKLRPLLETRLNSGARVVTLSSDMDGWQPDQIDRQELIFLYRMPPTPGSIETFLTHQSTVY